MLEGGYKIRNHGAVHFITFSVVEWIDVFTPVLLSVLALLINSKIEIIELLCLACS